MASAFEQPQTVVVLGGSSDIARAVIRKLGAAHAHTVVLAGRNQDLLDGAAQEARTYGVSSTETVIFDASDVANARATVSQSFDKAGGRVDLVIVAVGILGKRFVMEDDAEAAGLMATVNFAWPVAALAEVRRRLVSQGSGRILVMSSVAAVRVRRVAYLYDGPKAGLDRLCSGLADSLEGTGVTLQLLRPGFVRSKMTTGDPEPPFTTGVDEVAENVMKGMASGERVIWSPPILRYVFFALRHLPAPLWRKVMSR
jgi:decaprenylphospho-beta-D-erythro-pentofuranosid-2-ulose 2-reductase